jgi:biopolymer transport protein ExbD
MAGGGSQKSSTGQKKARIEIIPLIDVIFFLLATFVLYTLSLNRIMSLPVQLPVAQQNAVQQKDDDLVTLQVSDANTYYWNKEPISASDLPSQLETYKSQTKTPRILISGDNRAKFGATCYALDQVRKVGIDQVSIQTTTTTTGK